MFWYENYENQLVRWAATRCRALGGVFQRVMLNPRGPNAQRTRWHETSSRVQYGFTVPEHAFSMKDWGGPVDQGGSGWIKPINSSTQEAGKNRFSLILCKSTATAPLCQLSFAFRFGFLYGASQF